MADRRPLFADISDPQNVVDATARAAIAPLSLKSADSKSTRDYGAVGDAVLLETAATTAGSAVVTVTGGTFTSADVGKVVGIPYAGADTGTRGVGQTLMSTIASVQSANSITLANNAVQTLAGPRTVTGVSMSAGSFTLTTAAAAFTQQDVGKDITVLGAGPLRADISGDNSLLILEARITGFTSSTSVTISRRARRAVSAVSAAVKGATLIYGTDDTVALQAAFDDTASKGVELLLAPASYLTTASLIPSSNLRVRGLGRARILPVGNVAGICGIRTTTTSNTNPNYDVQLRSFEINAIGVTLSTYASSTKCIFNRFQVRPVFENLVLRNSCGTTLGCDFLVDYKIVNNTVYRGGRQVEELGQSAGGSGIGIGTGQYEYEGGITSGNQVHQCGNNGIFAESQSGNVLSRGAIITKNYVTECGGAGLGDKATRGTIIEGNTVELCNFAIEAGVGFVAGLYSVDGVIRANKLFGCGIRINFKDGSFTVLDNEIGPFDDTLTWVTNGQPIEIRCQTTGSLRDLIIQNNKLSDASTYGIVLYTGTFRLLKIDGNTMANVCKRSAYGVIDIQANTTNLQITDNTIFDSTGGTVPGWGIQLRGVTIGRYIDRGNDIWGMATAERNLSAATITTTVN
jgi:hypothetical protein